jgi:hypothetical protein
MRNQRPGCVCVGGPVWLAWGDKAGLTLWSSSPRLGIVCACVYMCVSVYTHVCAHMSVCKYMCVGRQNYGPRPGGQADILSFALA